MVVLVALEQKSIEKYLEEISRGIIWGTVLVYASQNKPEKLKLE